MSASLRPARTADRGHRRDRFRRSRAFRLAVVAVLAWVPGGAPVAEAQSGPAATGVFFSSRPPSGRYRADDRIQAVVTFAERLVVTGEPRLALVIGRRTRQAAFSSINVVDGPYGSTYLYFDYRVQPGDIDANGISIPARALTLNGGAIRSESGLDAIVDLSAMAIVDDARHRVNGDLNRAPSVVEVSIASSPRHGDTYGRGERVRIGVWFSEAVTVAGEPQLALEVGDGTRHASHTPGGGAVPWLWFQYDVQAGDRDVEGIGIARGALRLNGGGIRDAAGADAVLDLGGHAFADHPGHRVDGDSERPATVTEALFDSAPLDGDSYEHGERVSVSVYFDKIVTVTGTPTLALTIGDRTRPAAYYGASWSDSDGWTALWFRYYVQAEDRDADGIGIATGALSLNGGTIRDPGGGDAVLRLRAPPIAGGAGHRVDGSVDTTTPAVTDVYFDSRPRAGGVYRLGERVTAVVTLSEPVRVVGAPQLALTVGRRRRLAAFDFLARSTDNATHLHFSYRIEAADDDADGIGIGADALRLNGGSIRDRAGNPAKLDLGRHAIAGAPGHAVDAEAAGSRGSENDGERTSPRRPPNHDGPGR